MAPPDAIELAEFGTNGRNGAKGSDKDADESRNPANDIDEYGNGADEDLDKTNANLSFKDDQSDGDNGVD